MVSNSRRTPWATPAASFINRAASSKNRLLVWVIGVSSASSNCTNNGDEPPPPQEQDRGIVKPAGHDVDGLSQLDFALFLAASPPSMPFLVMQFPDFDPVLVSFGPFQIRWY